MRALISIISVLSLYPAIALAEGYDCKKDLSQSAMNYCIGHEADAAQKEMKATFAGILRDMNCTNEISPACKALKKSQNAWRQYMDSECQYQQSLVDDGSAGPSTLYSCQVHLIRERINQIKNPIFQG